VSIWLIVLFFVVGVILAFPTAILISAGLGALIKFITEPAICPRCGSRSLVQTDFIRATTLVNGRRAPDSWSLHNCKECNARLRFHRKQWFDAEACDLRYFDPRSAR